MHSYFVFFTLALLGLSQAALTPVRFFHASPDAPNVDVYVDNNIIWRNIAFGTLTQYTYLNGTQANFQVKLVDSGSVALTFTVDLRGTPLTVAAIDTADQIKSKVFQDQTSVGNQNALVRILHLSPDAPAVNVLARVQGQTVTLVEGLQFGQATAYTPVSAQCVDVLVALTEMPEFYVMQKRNVCLTGGTVYTAAAIGFMDHVRVIVSEDALPPAPAS